MLLLNHHHRNQENLRRLVHTAFITFSSGHSREQGEGVRELTEMIRFIRRAKKTRKKLDGAKWKFSELKDYRKVRIQFSCLTLSEYEADWRLERVHCETYRRFLKRDLLPIHQHNAKRTRGNPIERFLFLLCTPPSFSVPLLLLAPPPCPLPLYIETSRMKKTNVIQNLSRTGSRLESREKSKKILTANMGKIMKFHSVVKCFINFSVNTTNHSHSWDVRSTESLSHGSHTSSCSFAIHHITFSRN